MPLDTNIPLQAKFAPIAYEIPQPINTMMSMMKFRQLDQENALNTQKMDEYSRARTEEEGTRNYLAKTDLSTPEGRAGLRNFGKTGLAYDKALTEAETAGLTQKKTQFDIQKLRKDFVAQAQRDTSSNPSDANITAYIEDMQANPLFSEAEKKQMVAGAGRILALPVSERKAFMASQGASPEALKPSNLQINQSGQTQVLQMPAFGGAGTSVGTYADVPLPADVQAQNLQRAAAARPVTNVNVSTEKKYGEKLAGNIADRDDAKLGAAEKAPQLAESANRIIDLVKQGNVFTGPIADVKLNVARGLNVLGADNNAKIANTELLIAATGQSTLDAIKSAGLGTGQGFTDKDLNFLRGIAGGKIDFKPETLTELARLQHLAATRSVQAWNTRFKDIPKSSVEGMGLRTAPDVTPLSPSAIFARNPKTGERIQSLDGGNTWKPVGDK